MEVSDVVSFLWCIVTKQIIIFMAEHVWYICHNFNGKGFTEKQATGLSVSCGQFLLESS